MSPLLYNNFTIITTLVIIYSLCNAILWIRCLVRTCRRFWVLAQKSHEIHQWWTYTGYSPTCVCILCPGFIFKRRVTSCRGFHLRSEFYVKYIHWYISTYIKINLAKKKKMREEKWQMALSRATKCYWQPTKNSVKTKIKGSKP